MNSDEQQSRAQRWLAKRIASMNAVGESLPDHEPLSEDERPTCPYCERTLGVAPGNASLAWKCVEHGCFPAGDFEVNILRAMQADVESSNDFAFIFAGIALLPVFGVLLLLKRLMQVVTRD